MEYTLKVSALSGDIVPLMAVAQAMALRDATAGGTPFHKPMYDGRYHSYIRDLLEEVRSGRLQVCNHFGSAIAVDPNVEANAHFGHTTRYRKEPDWKALRKTTPPLDLDWETVRRDWKTVQQPGLNEPDWKKLQAEWESLRDALPNTRRWKTLCRYWQKLLLALSPLEAEWHHGFWSFSHIDLGPKEVDKDAPNNFWCTKLHILNQWAEKRGDSFTISHDGVGWIDERGYVVPASQQDATKGNDRIPQNKVNKIDKGPVPDIADIVPDKWYGTNLVAHFLGVSQRHVQNILIPEGKLKAEKKPHRWKVQGHDLIGYLKKSEA